MIELVVVAALVALVAVVVSRVRRRRQRRYSEAERLLEDIRLQIEATHRAVSEALIPAALAMAKSYARAAEVMLDFAVACRDLNDAPDETSDR
jgi:type II secretory pathway pseudopilin PulG